MSVKRDHMSFENGVDEAAFVLGSFDAVGDAAGSLKKGIARHWSNPNSRLLPNVMNALLIDQACIEAGHHRAPFLTKFIELSKSLSLPAIAAEPLEKIANLSIAVGGVAKVITDAKCPDGPGGESYTPNEVDEIMRAIAKGRDALDALEASVKADRPNGLRVAK